LVEVDEVMLHHKKS